MHHHTYLATVDLITEPPGDASILLTTTYINKMIISRRAGMAFPPNQLAVLGDAVDQNSFILDINAESLEEGYDIESTDLTIKFDPTFWTISE